MENLKLMLRKDPCQKHYSLTRTLGQGSFATVKLAIRKADQTKWAVKVIKKSSLTAEDEAGLQVEVNILQNIDHPNIVKLQDVFDGQQNFYMVMELCTGGELFDSIVTKEHYTEKEARECITAMVSAIDYCHDHDIVHRDLKPENLLYSSHDPGVAVLKLADFGLAQLLSTDALLKTACGTPGYVAPEVLTGQGYGKEVDMWSIGVISYILLCGFPPFYDENNQALFRAIKAGKYDYPSPYWDTVSKGAMDLVDRLLVLDPTKRYSAKDVLQHPWIKSDSNNSLGHFQKSMKAYNARRKFRATVHTVGLLARMGMIAAGATGPVALTPAAPTAEAVAEEPIKEDEANEGGEVDSANEIIPSEIKLAA